MGKLASMPRTAPPPKIPNLQKRTPASLPLPLIMCCVRDRGKGLPVKGESLILKIPGYEPGNESAMTVAVS